MEEENQSRKLRVGSLLSRDVFPEGRVQYESCDKKFVLIKAIFGVWNKKTCNYAPYFVSSIELEDCVDYFCNSSWGVILLRMIFMDLNFPFIFLKT